MQASRSCDRPSQPARASALQVLQQGFPAAQGLHDAGFRGMCSDPFMPALASTSEHWLLAHARAICAIEEFCTAFGCVLCIPAGRSSRSAKVSSSYTQGCTRSAVWQEDDTA
jgi:hypothetical protein